MGGKDDKDDARPGFPDDIFRRMEEEHKKYMREVEEQRRRDLAKLEKAASSTSPKDNNFFVDFKDFIDGSLSTLTESFRSLPGNIAELKAKMQEEREAKKQEEFAVWKRWTGFEDSPDYTELRKERASPEKRTEATSAALMLLRENQERNKYISKEKIDALYSDDTLMPRIHPDVSPSPMLSPGGACYYQADNGYNAPSTAIWRFGAPQYRWLSIDWFKRSPYSPIALEAHKDLGVDGPKWRAAFEDLLSAALDKPLASHEQVGYRWPYSIPQGTYSAPGLDWTLSLMCRGILPLRFPIEFSGHRMRGKGCAHAKKAGQMDADFAQAVREGLLCDRDDFGWRREWRFGPRNNLKALVDEIITPSPRQEMHEPEIEDHTAQQPETEQDLYDALYREFSDAAVEEREPSAAGQSPSQGLVSAPEQDKAQRKWDQAQKRAHTIDSLFDALEKGDAAAVKKLIVAEPDNDWAANELVAETFEDMDQATAPTRWEPTLHKARDPVDYAERAVERDDELARREEARERDSKERAQQEMEALGLEASEDVSKPDSRAIEPKEGQPKRVDVLSSLTTTQTTRLPDGTVTTKIVLKQQFADGREDTQEKIHTYQEPKPPQPDEQTAKEKQPRKRGWFWT